MGAQPFIITLTDGNGGAASGAKCYAYQKDTTTPQNVFTDSGLSIAAANPAIADADGKLELYLNDAQNYTLRIKDSTEALTLFEVDYVAGSDSFIVIRESPTDLTDAQLADISALADIIPAIQAVEDIDAEVVVVATGIADITTVADAIGGVTDLAVAVTGAEAAQTAAELAETNAETAETNAETAEVNAEAAQAAAEAARDAAQLSKGIFPSTAAALGRGVQGHGAITGGASGTDGTFPLVTSGGTQVVAVRGTFTVSGGAVTAIDIQYPGYYSSDPTGFDFSGSASLADAAAAPAMGVNAGVGEYFSVPASGDVSLILYKVTAGPAATEVVRYPSADYVLDRLDNNLSDLSGYVFALVDSANRPALTIDASGSVDLPGTARLAALYERDAALSGVVWGVTDQDDRLALAVMQDGRLNVGGQVLDLPVTQATAEAVDAILDPTRIIDCHGDSMTHGNTAGVTTPFPAALAALIPTWTVNNLGLSGRTSLQIATAFGAIPSILTVTNNTIPASGGVAVTVTENGNFGTKSNFGTRNYTGTLFGIHGTLAVAFNATDSNLAGASTFTRTTSGSETLIPNRTAFLPDTFTRELNTAIFWAGRNDILSQVSEPLVYTNAFILENIAAMVARLASIRPRYIILSLTDMSTEYVGAAEAQETSFLNILEINYQLARIYPYNFVDVRKILVNSYDANEPDDVTAFGRNQIPPSLSQDGIHLNDAGYAIVAQAVSNFITQKGW